MNTSKASSRSLTWVGLAMLVLSLPSLVLAAGGGMPIGQPFLIGDQPVHALQPAVVYNSQWQEYLVVYWNDRPGNDDIRAERVSKSGQLLGGKWIAAGAGADRFFPDVAYNSQQNQYLIVWIEQSAGYNYVRTQRFSGDLDPQPEGMQTLIAGSIGQSTSVHPVVDYAYTSDKYLVVWEYEFNVPPAPMATSIVGHVVQSDGTPHPSGTFTISQDPGDEPRRVPDLAYNRRGNGYLVVWQQWTTAGNLNEIWGRLVHGDGAPTSGPISIAMGINSYMNPAVAAIPTATPLGQYTVVYEDHWSSGERYIDGHRIEGDGTVSSSISLNTSETELCCPTVAGSEGIQHYLVAWARTVGPLFVYGQAFPTEGVSYQDQPIQLGGSVSALNPAAAGGPQGSFLVAYDDPTPGTVPENSDIYGRIWGFRVYLPLIVR